VPPAGDRLSDQLFGAAVAVHLGRVDVGHAQVQTGAECPDSPAIRIPAAFDHPGSLPDDRYFHARPSERLQQHYL
jgi:hypothetical protein